jgi:hypothetical protein
MIEQERLSRRKRLWKKRLPTPLPAALSEAALHWTMWRPSL